MERNNNGKEHNMMNLSESDQKLIEDMKVGAEEEKLKRPEDKEHIDRMTKLFINMIKKTSEIHKNIKSDDLEVKEKAEKDWKKFKELTGISSDK